MEMNIEKMDLNELISLREELNDAIEKAEKEKYRDIKTGDIYTISNDNGTKMVYLVLDENDFEYVDEFHDIIRVKYLCFFVDENGIPESRGKRRDEWHKFVEYVRYADVKHGCFEPYEYEDAVNKVRSDFYKKVNN